ncbi:MAG: FGGY-family carbohydrate kinase [Clostridia bacterium]|nr:FGGY-family carbohydrate kinase [Clostridia bacterium]
MKNVLIGIDIGTSSCKVAAFDRCGKVLGSASASYPVAYPHAGWAEQDPADWWEGVCRALRALWQGADFAPSSVAAVSVDGQSWSAVALDAAGEVLCPTPIWMDTRAGEICARLEREMGEELFALSGNALSPTYTTGKVIWLREHHPELFARARWILGSNGYIVYRLSGAVTQDRSQGYGWHCYDMRRGVWQEETAERMGIPARLLPPIVPCDRVVGEVTAEAARSTGLAAGTPVVAGGLDAACATLGAGVIEAGQTQEQGGQAGGMSICMDGVCADRRLILGAHAVPGRWLLQGGTVGGGGVLRWLERELGEVERERAASTGVSSFDQLTALAAAVPAGSDGLVVLPYMAGERTPLWDPDAKGIFYGLDFSKTRGHLIRAGLEGVAFSLRHNLEVAEQAGAYVGELCATGGAANSPLWTQIKADVTGKTIVVPASDTATTWGAAILGGIGVGLFASYGEAVRGSVRHVRRHEPNAALSEVYAERYRTYLKLYPATRGV